MLSATGELADVAKKVFYGPHMKTVTKTVNVSVKDAATGEVTGVSPAEKEVQVPDVDALKAIRVLHQAKIIEILEKIIPVYWALSWSLFDQPPSHLFAANRAKLAARYPEGFFTQIDSEKRDTAKEIAASEDAATQAADLKAA